MESADNPVSGFLSFCPTVFYFLFSGKIGKSFDGVYSHRAGIEPFDIHRCEGNEECLFLQFVQIFQHFKESDILGHADIMERLDVFISVLNGHPVTEPDAFYLMIDKPLGCLSIDKHTLVFFGIGQGGKGWI